MKKYLILAGIFGFLGVALGAFGAHGLEDRLVANGRQDTWQTATFYLFVHTLALLWISGFSGSESEHSRLRSQIALAWTVGILIFSGSLYLLSLTNLSFLGAITPLGGVSFLIGWILLIVVGFKRTDSSLEKS